MILLFTGAGGTGKTTMALAAAERYGVPYLESSAREVQAEWKLASEDDQLEMTPDELTSMQTEITDRQWKRFQMAAESPVGLVADRTVGDHFAYRVMKGGSEMSEEEVERYETRLLTQFTMADLVVHCPVGLFEPPPGDFRTESPVQRAVFDYFIRGAIDRVRGAINIMSMTVADPEARVQHLHSALLNVGALQPATDDEERLTRL